MATDVISKKVLSYGCLHFILSEERRRKLSDDIAKASKREIHRREFIRSCRTVAVFMLAYLGSLTPYYVLMVYGKETHASGRPCCFCNPQYSPYILFYKTCMFSNVMKRNCLQTSLLQLLVTFSMVIIIMFTRSNNTVIALTARLNKPSLFSGLGCGSECSIDSPEARIFRALVATALYLLPVIDPILYTKRFKVFKEAALSIWKSVCFMRPRRRRTNAEPQTSDSGIETNSSRPKK